MSCEEIPQNPLEMGVPSLPINHGICGRATGVITLLPSRAIADRVCAPERRRKRKERQGSHTNPLGLPAVPRRGQCDVTKPDPIEFSQKMNKKDCPPSAWPVCMCLAPALPLPVEVAVMMNQVPPGLCRTWCLRVRLLCVSVLQSCGACGVMWWIGKIQGLLGAAV